ncbi:MAG: hypothetical protein AABX93_03150 [Nanoarchaeota archaeon]
MIDLHGRVFEIRKNILSELSKEDQELAKMVEEGGYFITKVRPGGDEVFMIIDFTSKHEKHVRDLAKYSEKIYHNFTGKEYRC